MSELRTGPTSDNELTWLNNRAAYWIAKGDGLDNHFHAYGVMRLIDRLAAAESRISHLEAALREISYNEPPSDACWAIARAALSTPKERQT